MRISNVRLRREGHQNIDQLSNLDHVRTKSDDETRVQNAQSCLRCIISQNQLDTKNQLADMLTKGSFTRDGWCNLLRLFNFMIFSMFSRSHLRSIAKATTMSKRIQERKTEEELALAKPRSVCLISRNLNREQSSSFVPDASNVLENSQLDSGSVQRSCGKLQRNRNPNPATCSQVWKEDTPSV